jgi:hypothetical protein
MSVGSEEKVTVFVGDDVKPSPTNSQNKGTMANGFYFMFGSNGLAPNSNITKLLYEYNEGEVFANGTLEHNIKYRQPTVLKANITGAASFTPNLFLGGIRADFVLVSDDPTFSSPLSTRIYIVDGNFVASKVLINQGDYVGFAYFQSAPGGVDRNIVMWLRADEPSTVVLKGDKAQEWYDFSGNMNDIVYFYSSTAATGTPTPPRFKDIDGSMNFHPSQYFRAPGTEGNPSGSRDYLITNRAPFNVADPQQWTIIMVANLSGVRTFGNDRSYPFSFGDDHSVGGNSTRRPALGFQVNNRGTLGRMRLAGTSVNSNVEMFNPLSTTVTSYIAWWGSSNSNGNMRWECDGKTDQVTHGGNRTNLRMNYRGIIGIGSLLSSPVIGSIAEVIAYETTLDQNEKDKIYSYLSLKYGTTMHTQIALNQFTGFDYFLSDGSMVWQGKTDPLHARYHNNVAAIVRDDAAKLNNLQSHSTVVGSAVLMGIGTRLGYNSSLAGLNSNKEIIIWGNNGGSYTR